MSDEKIKEKMMKRIIGSKFNSIFRCLDMLCFNLGKDVQDNEGNIVPEYTFHIQTPWRFVNGERILVASRDICLPNNHEIDTDGWAYDLVGRPDDESSIFDVVAKEFPQIFGDATVTKVDVNAFGDLCIEFSNGITFETFTNSSRKDEEWRFLNAYDDDHFIVFDM